MFTIGLRVSRGGHTIHIKEIAEKLNISPRTIRFYEEKGLIRPSKSANNMYRTFSEHEIWKLQFIIALREVGMSIDVIKEALTQTDAGNQNELLLMLEFQRSVMFSQWLELKQIIETTDQMIGMIKQEGTLPLSDVYTLAEGSKKLRELRSGWQDRWNFDKQAPIHDELVANSSTNGYAGYDEALDLILQWVAPVRGECGLDIGTGTGNLAGRFLSQHIPMAAIDQSKEMLKQCRRKFPGLDTKLGNFLSIPYMDRQFDFIVSSFAFHHLQDAEKRLALAEMKRVLKPHGRICIADLMVASKEQQVRPDAMGSKETKHYANVAELVGWFEANGYITRHTMLNEQLCILYAVPIQRTPG